MPPAASFAPAATDSGDDPVDVVALLCVDDRPEGHGAAHRVADRQMVGVLAQGCSTYFRAISRCDQVPAGGHAHLALVQVRAPGADRGRAIDVHVVEDDQRVVAAELQVHLLEVLAAELAPTARPRGSSR